MHILVKDDKDTTILELRVNWENRSFRLSTRDNEKVRNQFTTREGMMKSIDRAFGELLKEIEIKTRHAYNAQEQMVILANCREMFGTLTFTRYWNTEDEPDDDPKRRTNLPRGKT
jgi:hypothetical protein